MAPGTGRRLARLLSLDDFEAAAQAHLPRPLFGYIAGAAETGATLADNRRAFTEYGFVTRILRDVSARTTARELFGHRYAAPFGIAPMGLAAVLAYRGDVVLAEAAAAAGVPFVMSGSSLIPMETVAAAAPGAWFQAYLPGEPGRILALLARVKRAGFRVLVLTVDTPVMANRENNVRNGFSTPLRPGVRLAWDGITHPRWLAGTLLRTLARHGVPHFENSFATRGVPIIARNVERDFGAKDHLDWSHLRLIRDNWDGVLVVKGITSPADAKLARDAGVDGVILSNHGGRQLDGVVSPLRVLPHVVAAVPDIPVMLDSGVRRGSDVMKALALGARFVFVGRPFMDAAAIGGRPGVTAAIDLLRAELHRNLAMIGAGHLDELGPDDLMALQGRPPAGA